MKNHTIALGLKEKHLSCNSLVVLQSSKWWHDYQHLGHHRFDLVIVDIPCLNVEGVCVSACSIYPSLHTHMSTMPFCQQAGVLTFLLQGMSHLPPQHLQGCLDKPWGWQAADYNITWGKRKPFRKHVIRHYKTEQNTLNSKVLKDLSSRKKFFFFPLHH